MATITESTLIKGVQIVEPQAFGDSRGTFIETYRREWFPLGREMLQGNRGDRQAGCIVGNEVNAHWEWYNLGNATRAEVVADYLRTVRITHTAVRKSSAHARVYLSLTHYWDRVMRSGPLRSCEGRGLIDDFNRLARAGGDFDWHLAQHPYPENLFEPRTWLDKQPTSREDTPKITFKNLEVLDAYFRRAEMLYQGKPRRIILSEQGFHCPDKPDGELWQAAAYCYAWKKVTSLAGI